MKYWLATFPNEGRHPDQTYSRVQEATASTKNDYCSLYQFEMPALLVGTLDSLISLSDDLIRVDLACEQAVRKIERQFHDIAGQSEEKLTISGVSVEKYVQKFVWDFARYPHRRPLPELVGHIQSSIGQIDEELKNLSASYQEKTQMKQALQRKKGGNLLVADLNDVLTKEKLQNVELVSTEHLETVIVIVNRNQEQAWEATYEQIGEGICSYGGPDWTNPMIAAKLGQNDGNFGPESTRASHKGSPVVPGSSVKILQDGDFILYAVTILKGHYEAGFIDETGEFQQGQFVSYFDDFAREAKTQKFSVRRFSFDGDMAGKNDQRARQLEFEVNQLHSGITRWCRSHFPEAFEAWIHLKVIRAFVESILKYGLPRDFSTVILKPKPKQEKRLETELAKMYAHLSTGLGHDEGEEEIETYVCQKFSLLSIM